MTGVCSTPCLLNVQGTSMILDVNKEPDFINELGIKWFYYKSGTEYANRIALGSKPLNAEVWIAVFPDSIRKFVIIKNGGVVAEENSLETLGIKIDILRMKY